MSAAKRRPPAGTGGRVVGIATKRTNEQKDTGNPPPVYLSSFPESTRKMIAAFAALSGVLEGDVFLPAAHRFAQIHGMRRFTSGAATYDEFIDFLGLIVEEARK